MISAILKHILTRQENRMKTSLKSVLTLAFCILCVQTALAGAPLKGIDVKLGKNPGGGCAARTTNDAGTASFGIWPKGNYTLSFVPPAPLKAIGQTGNRAERAAPQTGTPASSRMHIVIQGATAGKIERDIDANAASARVAPVQFSLSGTEELVVVVSAAP
jgi:hypothetical protein